MGFFSIEVFEIQMSDIVFYDITTLKIKYLIKYE